MTELNPKFQLAKLSRYPLALVFAFSYEDAAKLYELLTLLLEAYGALALAGGYDPANLTEEDHEDIREVLDFGEDGDPEDPTNIHLRRWHELHKQIYAIEKKYPTQSFVRGKIKKKGAGND